MHGASVAMLSPHPAVPPALVRTRLLQGPGAGAPRAGGEPWGAGWVQGDFGDALALFLLEGERFDAGLGGRHPLDRYQSSSSQVFAWQGVFGEKLMEEVLC